jgi:hypothetical protein
MQYNGKKKGCHKNILGMDYHRSICSHPIFCEEKFKAKSYLRDSLLKPLMLSNVQAILTSLGFSNKNRNNLWKNLASYMIEGVGTHPYPEYHRNLGF